MSPTATAINLDELRTLKERLESFSAEYHERWRPQLKEWAGGNHNSAAVVVMIDIEGEDSASPRPFLANGINTINALIAANGSELGYTWWWHRVDNLNDAGCYRRDVADDADEFERFDLAFANRFQDLWLELNRACDKGELSDELEAGIMAALSELTA